MQTSDAHVFFGGHDVRQCLSLHYDRPIWQFARQLPASVTRLKVMCRSRQLLDGLQTLKQHCNLEELDVHVHMSLNFERSASRPVSLGRAMESLSLMRVGLHASCGAMPMYVPDYSVAQMHRTCYIGDNGLSGLSLEDQMDHMSRQRVTKLTLQINRMPSIPSLSGFSGLKELVIGDCLRDFGNASPQPFSIRGLEVVAGTLKHLTISSSRRETSVELPHGLYLRSFLCVCSGQLHLQCNAPTLTQELGDVLLGYTTISGTGVKFVENLAPRLGAAVLEVLGARRLTQHLLFTRAGLVGQWWLEVFQISKQESWAGCCCCRMRIWAQDKVCPGYLTFMRYGIISAHEDHEALIGHMDRPQEEPPMLAFPGWHSAQVSGYYGPEAMARVGVEG